MSSKVATIPLRRAELISPMGVGSISTNSDGINMMPGALDLWYENNPDTRKEEYVFSERRLEKILGVKEFRLPPDYRTSYNYYDDKTNKENEIPMLRFPTWHYCNKCRVMHKLSFAEPSTKIMCSSCNKKDSKMIQVPLVISCSAGHIDDFPWNEWLHKSIKPECNGPFKYQTTGGPTLSSMKLVCQSCDADRNMSGVTTSNENGDSSLYTKLDSKGDKYKCTGRRHWFGTRESAHESCVETPYAILKNSTNLYFPNVINALFLPGDRTAELRQVIDVLLRDDVNQEVNYILNIVNAPETSLPTALITRFPSLFKGISQDMITEARKLMETDEEEDMEINDVELKLKKQEYDVLVTELTSSEHLKIVNEYGADKENKDLEMFGLKKINLVPVLRDTRVLYGFDRLRSETAVTAENILKGKKLLFKDYEKQNTSWLPGYTVYGEGIFFEFDDDLLESWEHMAAESRRYKKMENRLKNSGDTRVSSHHMSPRYIMLHTLAHLLIQEMVFECGYSTSALRERMYVSRENDFKMNGFLIYTASGDSEGTMGGLVRLGHIEKIGQLFKNAIRKSQWCSSDPVCNEIGTSSGQGVNHMNAAACHNCAYIPETSCEEFNRFLDRGMVEIYDENNVGFFDFVKDLKK